MGFFDRIFNLNNQSTEDKVESRIEETTEPIVVIKEIDEIINILGQLGLLNSDIIQKKVEIDKNFESSILKRIMIKTENENIDRLEKYFANIQLGYGSVKLNQFKDKMNDLASEKITAGANKEEVIEELIEFARMQVENYERVLKGFNETLKKLEENTASESELLVMLDYWTNYFKEQELGYPINLQNKVETMARELQTLPYGGYGGEEINRFMEAAYKMIEEAKNNKEESNHTVSRITSSLFTPKKNRYMADVETLKRKLQMITESPYLSDMEKEQNKQQTIREFNQMNGHSLGVEESIEQMKVNLSLLECGGFGPLIIEKFANKAQSISKTGNENGKSIEEIINDIQREYNKLLNEYQTRLTKLKEKIQRNQEENIPQIEKDRTRLELLEDFKDEMGHPVDFDERIEKLADNLRNITNGGYGESIISKFIKDSKEGLKGLTTLADKTNALRSSRKKFYELIDKYKELETELERKKHELENNKSISEEDRKASIEELERIFKIENGHVIDLNQIIIDYADELSKLGNVGYGKSAIEEYKKECERIINSNDDTQIKYNKIKQKYQDLVDRYMVNQNTFNEWKFLQLKTKSGEEKQRLSEDLDGTIAHMLSLSPNELTDFYLEDDKKKSEERTKHNYRIAYKFLAKQESRKNNDEVLYEKRMKELEDGRPAYTDDEINDAITRIERIELTAADIPDEDKLISVVEYIDSTLLRQMLYVEAATSKKRYSR